MKKITCGILAGIMAISSVLTPALAVEGTSATSTTTSTEQGMQLPNKSEDSAKASTKPDESKTEDTKPDESKTEDTKPDESKTDGTKPDESKTDGTKPEGEQAGTGSDTTTPGTAGTESTTPPTEPTTPPSNETPPVFTDLNGHWAQSVLMQAVADGYLKGHEDGTMRPNAPLTGQQVTTILGRYLQETLVGDSTKLISRADAFALIDEILLLSAGDETTSLAKYGDAFRLNSKARAAVSALLALGAIKGYEDGTLRPENTLSRAEFISILYKLPAPQKGNPSVSIEQSQSTRLSFPGKLDSLTLKDGVSLGTVVLGTMADAKLTLGEGSSIAHLVIVGSGKSIEIPAGVKRVTLQNGSTNTLTVTGELEELVLLDGGNTIAGTGSVQSLVNHFPSNQITLKAQDTQVVADKGLEGLAVTLTAPTTLPIGANLVVNAALPKTTQTLDCAALWLVNGKVVQQTNATVSPDGGFAQYVANFTYKKDMNTKFAVTFELHYTTRDGQAQVLSAQAATTLENYSAEYYDRYQVDQVLARVTTGYKGNYTTAWAEQHDYDPLTKTTWINAKGYSSKTNYLAWINISQQRVNIFEGSQGNWWLSKSFLCGTGKKGDDTPVGVYTVGTRTASGWTTSTYNVRPVVRFKMGSGLAFHSRKYDSRHTRMTDPSIGFPVSLGCIRMYDEDIWWIYDNLPQGSTVVVF